jgi:hypothetical protein
MVYTFPCKSVCQASCFFVLFLLFPLFPFLVFFIFTQCYYRVVASYVNIIPLFLFVLYNIPYIYITLFHATTIVDLLLHNNEAIYSRLWSTYSTLVDNSKILSISKISMCSCLDEYRRLIFTLPA